MHKLHFRFVAQAAVLLGIFWSDFLPAANAALVGIDVKSPSDVKTVIICKVASTMFWILIPLAVLLVLIAAYRYAMSSGDPNKISGATKTITWAAVAIIVALLAKNFGAIIASGFISGSTEITGC